MSSTAELSDLIVSAQDTFEEVLGWYGLRPYTQLKDRDRRGETGLMDSVSTKSLGMREAPPLSRDAASVSRSVASAMRDSSSLHSRDSSAEDDDVELDGDHPVDLTCIPPVSSSSSCAPGEQGTMSDLLKMQWGSHKKLVGIRFLFPPLDEQMSLLEKAKIWVARHDFKYFVDWTETELETVDPVLRPLSVITRDIYKLHMNRSEYCRNVKLKYCLQSEAPWAQRFRENLAKLPTEGGFTGLCQAKITAAELWRKYSEHYRSHQARHPHLRNRDLRSVVSRARDGDSKTEHETSASGSCYDALCTDSDALSEDCDREIDGKPVNQDSEIGMSSRNNTTEETEDTCTVVPVDDEIAENGKKQHQGTENSLTVNFLKRQTESDVEEPKSKKTANEIGRELESRNFGDFGEKSGNSFHRPLDSNEFSDIINLTKKDRIDLENRRATPLRQALAMSREAGIKTEASQEPEVKPELRLPLASNSFSYWNMSRLGPLMYQLPLAAAYYANPMNFMDSSLSSPVLNHQMYPYANASPNFTSSTAAAAGIDSLAALMPPKKSAKIRGSSNRSELNTEYRRSERGLSFLFPSFSDHNMSLLDKVQITITRHKNNYFLGWDEDALNKLDPLVRPKMVVTAEIYKEYCHRNAMKYDSNLQFAMESAELWAQEFRKKLSLPASEGGFTSLCEVKLEAGRLWREFSGKYRMHNIVKWQMDLNSNTVPAKRLTVGGAHYGARGGGKLPFRKIPRRQRHKDQRAAVQRGVNALPRGGARSSLPDGDLHFQHLGASQNHYGCEQLPKGSECSSSSPLIGSFSEGALPRVGSRSEMPVGELCRVSRSLDNSPSMGGGSSDGSVSNVSVVGDASRSPASGQFPRVTSTPHRLESTDEFLFSPLPRQMPVADQLSVWLERHGNNYFLGYPKESLSTLHTYLRPQVVVTRNVFQRHIPESMVDILGKIKWMMSSSEEWAVGFCSRVCKTPNDGGFSTFEEALTEALVLWHTNKERETYLRSPSESTGIGVNPSEGKHCPPDTHRQIYGNKETSANAADEIETELTETALNSSKFGSLHDVGASEKSDNGRVKPRSLLIRDNGALYEEDRSVSNGACSPSPSSEFRPESMVQLLWNLRHTLNVLCKDSPVESWEQRLVPFLPILKRVIGSGYTVPVSSTLCMVDLILAALHQRIEEVFSNSLSDKL